MDKLRGIDVSEFQQKMSFSPYDFVIVRASYGNGGIDKMAHTHAQRALDEGKLLAFYHYAYPAYNPNPKGEVDTFLAVTEKYRGKCLYALDWENESINYSAEWAYQFLKMVEERTGVVPLFYTFAYEAIKGRYRQIATRYPLWLAQTEIKQPDRTVWGKLPTIWQYSHRPYDFNIFYGTKEDWVRWTRGGEGEMTYDDFKVFMDKWLNEQEKKPADAWATQSLDNIKFKGLMIGDTAGNLMPQSYVKREELAVILDKML